MADFRSNRNVLFSCKYHVVFCPKYRKPVLNPPIDAKLKKLIQQVCDETQSALIEMEVMPDHVHLLIGCDPQYGIHRLVKGIKRRSSRVSKATPTRATEKSSRQSSFASILVSGADRQAYLLVDGAITFQTPIRVFDETKLIGTHLYSLIGPSPDGHSLKWNSFDIGGDPETSTTVDVWSDPVLGRIEYLDGAGVKEVAQTLHPGTTMVVTDFAASADTRTGPDFTVITEDRAIKGRRVKS